MMLLYYGGLLMTFNLVNTNIDMKLPEWAEKDIHPTEMEI